MEGHTMRPKSRGRVPARLRRLRLLAGIAAAVALVAALGYTASGASSATEQVPELTATPAVPDGAPIDTVKSRTGRIAETDPELLGRSDSTPVNVMVKLDYDSVATYAGGVQGLAATSPRKTGKKLKDNKGAVDAYLAHATNVEQEIVSDIQGAVSNETVRASYRVAYGGVAMQVPANEIDELLSVDGVVAVQQDSLEQPLTSVTPAFTGASAVWPSLGGSSTAGEGVIVGVIDTGIWPQHPSYADPGINHPGGTYGCEFGVAGDEPFQCNDKLIGAYAKTATYLSVNNALPGENCINEPTNRCSARDADGHGTHTSSTAAGSPVGSTPLFGVNRGQISGMAPGAHLIMYRVCLAQGCFGSDSVSAVDQAIRDGVDVLNFSISGGNNAYTDPVELAFLEAYEAGILVNASAGNAGPGAGTANHAGPWTNTVGASTSNRHFVGSLRITASNGDVFTATGATITAGVSTPTPVVLGSEIPGQPDDMCRRAGVVPSDAAAGTAPPVNFAPGSAAGKIVVCRRQVGARVHKSNNVFLGNGVGMILYNGLPNLGVNTDNHWVPSIHLENTAAGTHPLIAFLNSHTGEMATFTTGAPTAVRGDVMTSFSSRGPLGDFIKPDVTAPGIQILAGNSPDPFDTNFVVGPPGQQFMAIAGTSMSSPHGAGISALVKDAHPDWTPGQIKSALMTSSVQEVLKENRVTPSDPFDRGAGSIRANRAVSPTVTFDVTHQQYVDSATDPLNRVHLNLPSINANPMPGVVTTTRTMKNVTDTNQVLTASATAPSGASIDVEPKTIVVDPGETAEITVTINATSLANGQYFGQITLDPNKPGYNAAVLPVAFRKGQGQNSLVHACTPKTIPLGSSSDCVVEAQNLSPVAAQASLTVQGPQNGQLTVENVSAPGVPMGPGGNGFTWNGTLTPAVAPAVNSLTPGGAPFGFFPLGPLGVPALPGFGDETLQNVVFTAPFTYGTEVYDRVGISSNGYVVVGGGTSADNTFRPQTLPNPARPNNVLAPYWTDLNPAAGGQIRAATLQTTGGAQRWHVVEFNDIRVFTGGAPRDFQIWMQFFPVEKITYAFGPDMGAGDPEGLNTGAENRDGTSGKNLFNPPAPGSFPAAGSSLTVDIGAPTPGGKVTITYDAFGRNAGVHDVVASLTSSIVQGTTTDTETITVTN
jgi:Subtilase family/Fibronectin type-III domain/PA domain